MRVSSFCWVQMEEFCVYTRRKAVSTSDVRTDVFYLCTSGYQPPHMTSRRTGDNETKAYPKIHTYLLIVLTGDCLKRNASQKAM